MRFFGEMGMKIIGGKARGVELADLEGQRGVRPTIGRSREALFNALGNMTDARVLDLFSGTGALGLEAASRGAAQTVLVELEPARRAVIGANIDKVRRTGVAGDIEVRLADATNPDSYLRHGESFDVVFADPPYDASLPAFLKLAGTGSAVFPAFPGALVVWELPDAPGSAGNFIARLEGGGAAWHLRRFGGTEFLWVEN